MTLIDQIWWLLKLFNTMRFSAQIVIWICLCGLDNHKGYFEEKYLSNGGIYDLIWIDYILVWVTVFKTAPFALIILTLIIYFLLRFLSFFWPDIFKTNV